MMRKPLYILLTFIFLLNIAGVYLWFAIQQKRINDDVEQQIRKGITKAELTLVVVPLTGENRVIWIKPAKEFTLNGEMYDVVSSKTMGKNKYYYCIIDKKEKKLIANFRHSHASKKEADKRNKNSSIDRFIPRHHWIINNNYPVSIDYQQLTIALVYNILKIPSPPPKTVLFRNVT
jgi:hypothetical protein